MTVDTQTFDAQQIADAWKNMKVAEYTYRREVLYAQRQVGKMIAGRSCTLQQIADTVGTSKAYPHQLANRFISGDFEQRLSDVENGRPL